MLVKRKHDARVLKPSRSLKSLARSVGGRNREAIARQAVKDKVICSKVVEYLGKKVIAKEMCTQSTDSVLRKRDPKSLEEFELGSVIEEMKEHAPSTLTLLRSCLAGCRRSEATDIKNKGGLNRGWLNPTGLLGFVVPSYFEAAVSA